MTARASDDEPVESAEVEDATAGESDESTSRGPLMAVVVVVLVIAWRLIVAFPEVALVAAGSLGTIGVQKIRARWGRHGDDSAEAEQEDAQPDVGEALRRLVGDDKGVLLTVLRDELDLPDTKVTDEGLKELAPLKNLTALDLRRTRVTDAGVRDLQKALPECKIAK